MKNIINLLCICVLSILFTQCDKETLDSNTKTTNTTTNTTTTFSLSSSGITPKTAIINKETIFSVKGLGLTKDLIFRLDGEKARFISINSSNTELKFAATPIGESDYKTIEINRADNSNICSCIIFTTIQKSSISKIEPSIIYKGEETTITIKGANLDKSIQFSFGGLTKAKFISINDKKTEIKLSITPNMSAGLKTCYISFPNISNNIYKSEITIKENIITPINSEIEMITVNGGQFLMGSNNGDKDEMPIHKVTLNSFSISKYELTQGQWEAIMGKKSEDYKGDNFPVQFKDLKTAKEFIIKLNEKTGKEYRFPTEAEWEYAAKGGDKSKGYEYAGSDNISEVAVYVTNILLSASAVGTKKPNELEIYDMSGNLSEFTSDYQYEYTDEDVKNPHHKIGMQLNIRGGNFLKEEKDCRTSNREQVLCYNGSFVDASIMAFKSMGLRLVLDK